MQLGAPSACFPPGCTCEVEQSLWPSEKPRRVETDVQQGSELSNARKKMSRWCLLKRRAATWAWEFARLACDSAAFSAEEGFWRDNWPTVHRWYETVYEGRATVLSFKCSDVGALR